MDTRWEDGGSWDFPWSLAQVGESSEVCMATGPSPSPGLGGRTACPPEGALCQEPWPLSRPPAEERQAVCAGNAEEAEPRPASLPCPSPRSIPVPHPSGSRVCLGSRVLVLFPGPRLRLLWQQPGFLCVHLVAEPPEHPQAPPACSVHGLPSASARSVSIFAVPSRAESQGTTASWGFLHQLPGPVLARVLPVPGPGLGL